MNNIPGVGSIKALSWLFGLVRVVVSFSVKAYLNVTHVRLRISERASDVSPGVQSSNRSGANGTGTVFLGTEKSTVDERFVRSFLVLSRKQKSDHAGLVRSERKCQVSVDVGAKNNKKNYWETILLLYMIRTLSKNYGIFPLPVVISLELPDNTLFPEDFFQGSARNFAVFIALKRFNLISPERIFAWGEKNTPTPCEYPSVWRGFRDCGPQTSAGSNGIVGK